MLADMLAEILALIEAEILALMPDGLILALKLADGLTDEDILADIEADITEYVPARIASISSALRTSSKNTTSSKFPSIPKTADGYPK